MEKEQLETGAPVVDRETGKIYMLLEILEDEGLARVSVDHSSTKIPLSRLERV